MPRPGARASPDAAPFRHLAHVLGRAGDAGSTGGAQRACRAAVAHLAANPPLWMAYDCRGRSGDEGPEAELKDAFQACLQELARAGAKATDDVRATAEAAGVPPDAAAALADAWATNGETVRKLARSVPFGGRDGVLLDAEWELVLPLAEGSAGDVPDVGAEGTLEPLARIDLHIAPGMLGASADRAKDLTVELTHEELVHVFAQMENVQAQLDAISK